MLEENKSYEEKIESIAQIIREFDYAKNGALSSIGFLDIMKLELIKIEMEDTDEDTE